MAFSAKKSNQLKMANILTRPWSTSITIESKSMLKKRILLIYAVKHFLAQTFHSGWCSLGWRGAPITNAGGGGGVGGGGGAGRRVEGRFAGFYGISTSPPHPQEMHGSPEILGFGWSGFKWCRYERTLWNFVNLASQPRIFRKVFFKVLLGREGFEFWWLSKFYGKCREWLQGLWCSSWKCKALSWNWQTTQSPSMAEQCHTNLAVQFLKKGGGFL